MKKVIRYSFILIVLFVLSGCESQPGSMGEKGTETAGTVIADVAEKEKIQETGETGETEESQGVDVDLTQMGSDMVYATVYQMMVDPETYVGKTVRMRGSYYATWYEQTMKYYHYVIINDATACCSQGMEFVWEDGNHKYPEEYPAAETEVEVTGVFETYREEGDTNLYCRLKDAVIKWGEN